MEQAQATERNAKLRAVLYAHRKRTGIGLSALLTDSADAPAGLSPEALEDFYRGGEVHVARRHLDYVIQLWGAQPDRHRGPHRRPPASLKSERVELTPEIRATLRAHWMRVGLSVDAFFERISGPPPRLSGRMIGRWLSDDAPGRVRKEHLECVLAAWERLPDGLGCLKRIHFIPFVGSRTELST